MNINIEEIKKFSEDQLIEKINFFTKLQKTKGLTEEEEKIREHLRKEYIDRIKRNLKAHLESIKK